MSTQGKPLNNKSFYANSQGATGAPDIAMPPLDQTPSIATAAPDPWQQAAQQQTENPFSVPDQLPDDVVQEMASVDNQSTDEPVQTQQQEQQKISPQDSFKSLRDAQSKAERERDALLSQMLEMQQRMQSMQQQQQPREEEEAEDDDDLDLESDALVEGKHVKKVTAKLKAMEKQLQRYQAQSQEVAVEARIRAQYPDFEKVVSPENVAILNERYPEIARTLRDTPDIFNKAASAYSVIKNFGIHKDTPQFENERAKAVANSQKPRPLASVSPTQGDSPLSRANAFANGMTDELKEQLRKEMFAARRAM